ncbi:MAG: Txe/YoeB family addiction module toxin [Bacteroidales bacterium]|nr:Txe/YoeB family addiction module toxin [Bacteroidales bacterium]
MKYPIDFTDQALKDISFFKKAGYTQLLSKAFEILQEIAEHPFSGSGKPEPLKHNLSGKWSRRINLEHRIIYELIDDTIVVYSLRGHY